MNKPQPTKYRESHPDEARLIDGLDDRGCRCYIDFGEQIGDANRGEQVLYERCRCWNTNAGPLWLYQRWTRVDNKWLWSYGEWSRPIEGSNRLGIPLSLLAGEPIASVAVG